MLQPDGVMGAGGAYAAGGRDIPAEKDALFNDVYNEHCENLRAVPGVLAIRRYRTGPAPHLPARALFTPFLPFNPHSLG